MVEIAEIEVLNGKVHIYSFWALKDYLEGQTKVEIPSSFQETKTKPRKEKLVEGVSRAPVQPESKVGKKGLSKEEFERIKQILEEVTTNE